MSTEILHEYVDKLKSQVGNITAGILLMLALLLGNPEAAQGQTSERSKDDVKNLILNTFIKNDSTAKAQFLQIRQSISIMDIKTIDDLLGDAYLKGDKGTLIEARVITFYILDPNGRYSSIGGYSRKQVDKFDNDRLDRPYVNKRVNGSKFMAAISKLKDE